MDIKQIYREETDLEPYHKSYGDYGSYDDKYVKWLEAKINYTHCCKSDIEQLFCDCYIKYPRGDGDCRRCGLPAKP